MDTNIRQKIPIVVQGGIAEVKIGGAKAKLLKGQLEKIGTRLGNCVNQDSGSQEGDGGLAIARVKRQRFPKVKTIIETYGGTMKKERSSSSLAVTEKPSAQRNSKPRSIKR